MFARKVAVRLKPDSLPLFAALMDGEILPWLRQQEGFLDLITLAAADGSEVATITFWDHEGNAEVCNSTGYPLVVRTLEQLLGGVPYVKTYYVVSSTCHSAPLARPAETGELDAGSPVQENGPAQPGGQSCDTTSAFATREES